MKCINCTAGMIAGTAITAGNWDKKSSEFQKVIDDWNIRTRREAIPHPGFAVKFNYCPNCGAKL